MRPVAARLIPFVSVSVANIVNVPIIRIKYVSRSFPALFTHFRELLEGITIEDENGQKLGKSTRVACSAIPMVVVSRICMSVPFLGMLDARFLLTLRCSYRAVCHGKNFAPGLVQGTTGLGMRL